MNSYFLESRESLNHINTIFNDIQAASREHHESCITYCIEGKHSEGKDVLNHKQIRIADQAEIGWKLVKQYDASPLADDSEDERLLNKAEQRANRMAKAEKRSRRRFNPDRQVAATITTQSLQSSEGYGAGFKNPGLCFLCQKIGPLEKRLRNVQGS